ncbi:hypothetical protein SAMN02745181_2416 [Rubritalea squalenifaciens DSM 18772]|uniref:Uncharacterized protein n=2 Tax=Rubritalea squalenifaciens TaxID=407226 RepID=A0A1M6LJP6_9BACT|nr:hypothetical protein SAMN02745181_2416 [Rubritalea squalenifaciens DSM 18772]
MDESMWGVVEFSMRMSMKILFCKLAAVLLMVEVAEGAEKNAAVPGFARERSLELEKVAGVGEGERYALVYLDLNEDGVREVLMLFPGGSGGMSLYVCQQVKGEWEVMGRSTLVKELAVEPQAVKKGKWRRIFVATYGGGQHRKRIIQWNLGRVQAGDLNPSTDWREVAEVSENAQPLLKQGIHWLTR